MNVNVIKIACAGIKPKQRSADAVCAIKQTARYFDLTSVQYKPVRTAGLPQGSKACLKHKLGVASDFKRRTDVPPSRIVRHSHHAASVQRHLESVRAVVRCWKCSKVCDASHQSIAKNCVAAAAPTASQEAVEAWIVSVHVKGVSSIR